MISEDAAASDCENVVATLNYLARGCRPAIYAEGPGAEEVHIDDVTDPRIVTIWNARPNAADFSLDREGFRLIANASHTIGDGDAQIAAYLRDVEALVRAETGALHVRAFDATLRSSSAAAKVRAPVLVVHNDFTDRSAQETIRQLLDDKEHEMLAHRRFAILTAWRPITEVRSFPLALADARTIAVDDLVVESRHYANWRGERHRVVHSARHRWYSPTSMQPDELLLFKVYDSSLDGPARRVPHSAFETDNATAARTSIEVRVLVVY